jgi:hypothetical protein
MGERRRSYKRSTPIGRLRRNADKIARHALLSQDRLKSWQDGVPNPHMQDAWKILESIINKTFQLSSLMDALEKSGWEPPKKTGAIHFEPGQHVAIAPGSREKYKLVFGKHLARDPDLMDDLVIEAILPSGGISVRRGRGTPCLIPAKSHLVLVEK